MKEDAFVGLALTGYAEVAINSIIYIGSCVLHFLGHIEHKILGRLFDRDIMGITIHASHIAMYDPLLIAAEFTIGNTCHSRKLTGCIKSTERSPMVVSTKIDILIGMFSQCGVYINRFHSRFQVVVNILDGRPLGTSSFANLIRAVELC